MTHATIAPPQTQIDNSAKLLTKNMFDSVFERSRDFRIEMEFGSVLEFVRCIDQYNEFDWRLVTESLECIDRHIPRQYYNPGNPNNGSRRHRISIGREGSPVIYLTLCEWPSDNPMAEATMKMICQEMELHGKADEADYQITPICMDGRKVEFRFWWD